MKTFQEFQTAVENGDLLEFIRIAINDHKASKDYNVALDADEYEAERNVTINEYVRWLYNSLGQKVVDFTAANNRIASNFLHRLVTQRITYSLGNGVSFSSEQGASIKEKLGNKFDTVLFKAARYARRVPGCVQ